MIADAAAHYHSILSLLVATSVGSSLATNHNQDEALTDEEDNKTFSCFRGNVTRFEIFGIHFHEVHVPFTIFVWILLASGVKIAFHRTRFPKYFPESCLLIGLGFALGAIVLLLPEHFQGEISGTLNGQLFFIFLLPPIMLEAGYYMPSKAFFNNIGTILLYAVVGTIFNAMTIGFSLYGVSMWLAKDFSLLECLTFSSLISAVDPVAVLAVFEEINVNEVLHILVFGESLLNDAVTIVLYRMFENFNEIGGENLDAKDVVSGLFSFVVVSIGGTLVGLIFGLLTACMTRFTHHVVIVEPIMVLSMSYGSYLTAEMLHLSPILSVVVCAMLMKPYVEKNICTQSRTTLRHVIKMLSSVSETIIFIFLGGTTFTKFENHEWDTAFVFFTLIFCFVYRFVGVIWQTSIINRYRLAPISRKDQFVMGYGGIRGAIAFSLVALLCPDLVPNKKIMFTTTVVIVMFTMFIQGITIKPLVNILDIKRYEETKPTMNEKLFKQVNTHIMAGIEGLIGNYGDYRVKKKWKHFNREYLERILLRDFEEHQRLHRLLQVSVSLQADEALHHIHTYGTLPTIPSGTNIENYYDDGQFSDEDGEEQLEHMLPPPRINFTEESDMDALDQNFVPPPKTYAIYRRQAMVQDDRDELADFRRRMRYLKVPGFSGASSLAASPMTNRRGSDISRRISTMTGSPMSIRRISTLAWSPTNPRKILSLAWSPTNARKISTLMATSPTNARRISHMTSSSPSNNRKTSRNRRITLATKPRKNTEQKKTRRETVASMANNNRSGKPKKTQKRRETVGLTSIEDRGDENAEDGIVLPQIRGSSPESVTSSINGPSIPIIKTPSLTDIDETGK